MYFRFGSAVVIVVLISLAGVDLEKRILELRRGVSRQSFQMDILRDERAKMRLQTHRLEAWPRLVESPEYEGADLCQPMQSSQAEHGRQPLLHWRRPVLQSQ